MQRTITPGRPHHWLRRAVLPVLLTCLLWIGGSQNAEAGAPKCLGPYAITADGSYPAVCAGGTNNGAACLNGNASQCPGGTCQIGDDMSSWWGDLSIEYDYTSGTCSVQPMGKLPGSIFVAIGSPYTNADALTKQVWSGPLAALRFTASAGTNCVASIIACMGKGE